MTLVETRTSIYLQTAASKTSVILKDHLVALVVFAGLEVRRRRREDGANYRPAVACRSSANLL